MFLPPERRQPRLPPSEPPAPKRALTKRGEKVVLWLVGFFLISMLLAPIGGSSLVDALWFIVHR